MVKLLKDLKVAEIRSNLTERGESTEGKKPVLLQVNFLNKYVFLLQEIIMIFEKYHL
jgi:hypothetical protein